MINMLGVTLTNMEQIVMVMQLYIITLIMLGATCTNMEQIMMVMQLYTITDYIRTVRAWRRRKSTPVTDRRDVSQLQGLSARMPPALQQLS